MKHQLVKFPQASLSIFLAELLAALFCLIMTINDVNMDSQIVAPAGKTR